MDIFISIVHKNIHEILIKKANFRSFQYFKISISVSNFKKYWKIKKNEKKEKINKKGVVTKIEFSVGSQTTQ